MENAAQALGLAQALEKKTRLTFSESAIRQGLLDAHWPGRLEKIAEKPKVILDGAHNADSVKKMLEGLKRPSLDSPTQPASTRVLRNLVVDRVPPVDKAMLRQLADSHRERLKSGVVLLASATDDGKVSIVVSISKDLAGRLHAGQIVKRLAPIVGGSGGGRPDFAEAGGKDASRIDEMLSQGEKLIQELLETGQTQSSTANP